MNSYKKKSLQNLATGLLIVLAINLAGSKFYARFDLTKEKRFTLTKATKLLLKSQKDPVFIEVYLEGKDLPAGIKKLRNGTKEMLEEFRTQSGGKVDYHFFDISKIKDAKKKEAFEQNLIQKGIVPTNLQVKKESGYQENLVYPGALVRFKGKELPVQILESQMIGAQGSLDNSLNFLEYKLANTIHKLNMPAPPRVAFVTDKGNLAYNQVADFVDGLSMQNFLVQKIDIGSQNLLHSAINILIIAKPTQRFSEIEKFKIDQFVMGGGKVLWMIDANIADLDSFKTAPGILSVPRDLNLTDQLFRYGTRINNDFVLDLYCNPIPIVEIIGGKPETQFFPWVFYPVVPSKNNHPVVKNLDPVALKFASSIDTIRVPGLNKTVLLSSSQYSRAEATPFEIYLGGAKEEPVKSLFNRKDIPLCILLEGKFRSLYEHRIDEELKSVMQSEGEQMFLNKSPENKMIVISDGDICANDVDQNGSPLPLGYYKFTKETFANKSFIMNCVEYLMDDIGLIDARNREIKMRLLDKAKINDAKSTWQMINILFPIVIMGFAVMSYAQRRKRKYTREAHGK